MSPTVMIPAPVPPNETARLQALLECGALDTPAEQAFDDLTIAASRVCGTPIALITLIDSERQWFKSTVGLETSQTAREQAFCAHAILNTEVLVVPDTRLDPRFADNWLVAGTAGIRSYAGAPLITPDGLALGTLCVMDFIPRKLRPEQIQTLQGLARQAAAQLQLRREVAARARVEQALEESRRRLELALLATGDRLWDWDMVANRLWMTPRCAEMLGYAAGELESNPRAWTRLMHPDDRRGALRRLRRHLRGEPGRWEVDLRFRAKSGAWLWLHLLGKVVARDIDLAPIRMTGTIRDVTERKRVEDALRHSEAQLRAFLESASQGILSISRDGRIQMVNAKIEEMFGYTRNELLGQEMEILLPERYRSVHLAHRGGFFAAPRVRSMGVGMDLAARRKDGTEFPVEIGLSYVQSSGDFLSIAFVTDISERKQWERRLRDSRPVGPLQETPLEPSRR